MVRFDRILEVIEADDLVGNVRQQGAHLMAKLAEMEAKFEARNIFGRGHEEFQQSGDNRIDINTYDLGQSFALSISAKI